MPLINGRRTPGPFLILLASQLVSCEAQGSEERADACRVAQPPRTLDTRIPESSGVAASRQHTGVFWTHMDSGHEAELFAIDADGKISSTITLEGASNFDWEDIAVAKCPSGSCLYVADTGNNNRVGQNTGPRFRSDLYRLPEPAPGASAPVKAERFKFHYPDGTHDAEALFVLPPERIFVVTRGRGDPIGIYAYPGPLREDTIVSLERVRMLSAAPVPLDDQVTGADATKDGRWVVLRTPSALFFYPADQLLGGSENRPIRAELTGIGEIQGEGVAIGDDGVVVLTSEGFGGLQGGIAMLSCGFLNDE